MFIKFHSTILNPKQITGSFIENEDAIKIKTWDGDYVVYFKTKKEAVAALDELQEILKQHNNDDTDSTTDGESFATTASKSLSVLVEILDTIKDAATAGKNVSKVSIDNLSSSVLDKLSSVVSNDNYQKKILSNLFDKKEELMDKASTVVDSLFTKVKKELEDSSESTESTESTAPIEPTSTAPKQRAPLADVLDNIFSTPFEHSSASEHPSGDFKKLTVSEFKKLFGTPDEPQVGDLRESQLSEFISEFVNGALDNDRVKDLFDSIKANFGEDEANNAIEGYKNLILTLCLQNTEMTLSEIINKYFS